MQPTCDLVQTAVAFSIVVMAIALLALIIKTHKGDIELCPMLPLYFNTPKQYPW